ncbi:MAG: molybdate ABC transporter substrate-binding protein [Actinobacteria bacterium]|nr:molybdate ABC transporter substrate-binding protein [Actinomycetota bacterium]
MTVGAFRATVMATAVGILGATGCGSPAGGGAAPGERTLTILAASSLGDVFEGLGAEFERRHDGVRVVVAVESSTTLALQAAEGAPGDVLATADAVAMERAVDGGAVAGPAVGVASNRMVLVAPAGNPGAVAGIDDLRRVRFARCVVSAPCGRLAVTVLGANGVEVAPISEEPNVRAVLARVVDGEVDAGLVYRSDALAAGAAVRMITIPGAARHRNVVLMARLAQRSDDGLARAWIALVSGPAGRRAFARAGFGRP